MGDMRFINTVLGCFSDTCPSLLNCVILLLIFETFSLCFKNCGLSFVFSFNIDESQPIVIKNLFHDEDAHFGATVSLFGRKRENNGPPNKFLPTGWVVIGAPKANSTNDNHTDISEPGVIWRCALGRFPEPSQTDCNIMQMDPTGKYDPRNPKWAHQDKKDGSWIGGAMSVGTDRFVTCGSRWINSKYSGTYLMNGICYWVPSSHVMADQIDENWPWLPANYSYRLNALLKKDQQFIDVPIKNGLSTKWIKSLNWACGQMGFSINIPKNNEMIIGAPGVFEWTGTVIQMKDSKNPEQRNKRFNTFENSSVFSEILVARMRRGDEMSKILQESDYFGYSVTSGNFFHPKVSQNRTQYAAGAPRSASLSGKVLVFSFNDTGENQSAVLDYLTKHIDISESHVGSYGSYFGSVLTAVDVNNDGFDDLLIGASQYQATYSNTFNFMKQQKAINETLASDTNEFSGMTSGDEGCVFLYLSTGYSFQNVSQEICGDKLSGARFGSAISILGDINSDNYNDIAVGAPYENEDRGAVYIYHGGESLTLAQKLLPKYIDFGIRGFGYSLSSGIDIDGNFYPDLAVGAYQSNQIVIFRTIPLANFSATLTPMVPKLINFDIKEDFNITSCISFSGRSLPSSLNIGLKLTIEHDSKSKNVLRWDFPKIKESSNISNLRQPSLTFEKLLTFSRTGTCYNFTISRIGEFDILAKEVQIRKYYWIHGYNKSIETKPIFYEIDKDPEGLPNLKFNESQPKFHDFKDKLPISITNMFGTTVLHLPIEPICESDGDSICTADLNIQAVFRDKFGNAFGGSDRPFVIGSSGSLNLEIELWNYKEIANLPITLDIKWKSPPITRKASSGDCEKIKNNHHRCFIKRPIKENRMESINVEFNMSGLFAGETRNSIKIQVAANTSSQLLRETKSFFELPLEFHMEVLNYTHEYETSLGNNLISSETFNFSQTYEVTLIGPTPIYSARLEIYLPKWIEINGQTHEFILLRQPMTTYEGKYGCRAVNGSFLNEEVGSLNHGVHFANNAPSESEDENYENNESSAEEEDQYYEKTLREDDLSVSETATDILRKKVQRTKRDTWNKIYNIFNLDNTFEGQNGILKLNCQDPKIKCMKMDCEFKYFHDWSTSVIFKLRLKNSVTQMLLKGRDDIQFIWFESSGTLKMVDKKGQAFGNSANLRVTTKLKVPEPVDVSAWVLIVSILGGILILTFIIISLVKCGFFRRKNKEKLEILKANDRSELLFFR